MNLCYSLVTCSIQYTLSPHQLAKRWLDIGTLEASTLFFIMLAGVLCVVLCQWQLETLNTESMPAGFFCIRMTANLGLQAGHALLSSDTGCC